MSTEEPKPGSEASPSAKAGPVDAAAGSGERPPADVDAAVAWPPPEAAPGAEAATAGGTEAAARESSIMTAPEAKPAAQASDGAAAEMPGTTPQEEMGLSNSTLHWLEDGEQAVPSRLTEPGTMPSYDPRAPVAGRRRAVLVVGGAALVALIVAGWFYADAQQRRAAQAPAQVTVEPARDLTTRAEAALAAGRHDEALDLAHLALTADQRFADAHFVVASVQQARGQFAAAREELRRYLELAPLGTHSQAARSALTTMPP